MFLLLAGCHAYLDLPGKIPDLGGEDTGHADTGPPDSDTHTAEDTDCDLVWYPDADGDGYGDASTNVGGCDAPEGYVGDPTDCDDTDAAVSPGTAEACANRVDDDCDGATDEECPTCDIIVPTDRATIQGGIDDAAAGQVVCVLPGTYAETIDFDGKGVEVLGVDGPTVTTIDAGTTGRVATFTSGEDASAVLSGFTLTGGWAESGGCVQVQDASPTLTNLVVFECAAEAQWAGGGGIELSNSGSRLSSLEVYANSVASGYGGGIWIDGGTVVIEDAYIHDNGAHYGGGGLYIVGGTLTLDDVTFESNVSHGSGGGLAMESTVVALTNASITGNTVEFGNGAGLYSHSTEGSADDVTVSANTTSSGWGAGIYVLGPLSLTRVSVTDNYSVDGGGGGGLYLGGEVVATDLEVIGNVAMGGSGGGVYLDGDITLTGAELADNRADSGSGGGLYLSDGTLEMVNAVVSGNALSSGCGAGISARDANMLRLRNVVVASNVISGGFGCGAGIYLRNTPATLESVLAIANSATSEYVWGVGLSLYGESTNVTVANSAFVANEAVCIGAGACCGAGIGTDGPVGDVTIHGVIFADNLGAGGMCVEDGAASTDIRSTDAYGNGGSEYVGLSSPTGTNGNVELDPMFVDITPADPLDWDLHLATTSPLVDIDTTFTDPDGSAGDAGLYSGTYGAAWDLDRDGYSAWWQPGAYASTYASDCDDEDETVFPGGGC